MKVGLVIAVSRELKAFLEKDFQVEQILDGFRTILKTTINNNTIYAVQSGFGLIDAAATTELLISKYGCDTIINFGVAGAVAPGLQIADLFVVKKVCNYGYDVSKVDPVKPHQYEELPDEFFPLDEHLIQLAKLVDPTIREAIDASGDVFVADMEEKEKRHRELGATLCEMETAAIARVAFLHHIPVLSIKCISDTLEGSGVDFNEHVIRSAAKAFELVEKILYKL